MAKMNVVTGHLFVGGAATELTKGDMRDNVCTHVAIGDEPWVAFRIGDVRNRPTLHRTFEPDLAVEVPAADVQAVASQVPLWVARS